MQPGTLVVTFARRAQSWHRSNLLSVLCSLQVHFANLLSACVDSLSYYFPGLHFPLLNRLPFNSFLNWAMSPTEILCKGLAVWRQSVPLLLEKSLQDERQEYLRVLRHFWRILLRTLWKYVRLTHPKKSEGGPKGGRTGETIWMRNQSGKRSWGYGKIQFWKQARKSLGKPLAQSTLRRCDNPSGLCNNGSGLFKAFSGEASGMQTT